jgi:DNA-binding transcriptional ArsR family regulator
LAVVLQRLAISQQARRVALGNVICKRFGLTRNAKYRALRSLEEAGLVAVRRKLGRSPKVTILDEGGVV